MRGSYTMSQELNAMIIEEWRELGFYYDINDDTKEWIFIGSRAGILKFCDILKEYSEEIRNDHIGEHDHYRPYMYLEIMTWNTNGVNHHSIHGSLTSLNHLSNIIIIRKLDTSNDVFCIDDEYSSESTYKMKFIVKEDSFDPASADSQLW